MSSVEPLYRLLTNDIESYSKDELALLEASLFLSVCKQLKEVFRNQYREYFCLMKFTAEMENAMLDADFISFVINDILSTDEYNVQGMAYHMNIHEDIIHEIIAGRNNNPSAIVLQKVIDLHCSVRSNLYQEILKKIAISSLAVS